MASLFLSYARDDADTARAIAAALEKAGHSVWWDKHIGGGAQFAKEIEQALDKADVVLVLWTTHSIESPWVRDEAGAGRDRGRLVPLSLGGTLPPLGFRQFHSIDLGDWSAGASFLKWRNFSPQSSASLKIREYPGRSKRPARNVSLTGPR